MMPRISQPNTMYIVILTNYCWKMLDSFLDLINVVSLYYTLTLMPWQNSSSFTMNSPCMSNRFVCTCTSHGSFHSMPISSHATQPIFQLALFRMQSNVSKGDKRKGKKFPNCNGSHLSICVAEPTKYNKTQICI